MVIFVVFLLSLTVTLCVSLEEKSHDIWLTRLELGDPGPNWVTNTAYKLQKINRNRKSLDLNFTLVQEVKEDSLMCEVNFFQKNGGKYSKALYHIPKTSCCNLIDSKGLVWRCLREKSNYVESCPIPVGDYLLKDFDPNECDYPKVLPPNGVEDYKIEFNGFIGSEQIWKHVGYGVLKKKIKLV